MSARRNEADDVRYPVSVGSKCQARSTTPTKRTLHVLTMRRGGFGEIGTQLRRRAEFTGAACFGVVEDHIPDIGQFEVPRIEYFHCQHIVSCRDRSQRSLPIDRTEEITDHNCHPPPALRATKRFDGRTKISSHAVGGTGRRRDGPQQRLRVDSATPGRDPSRLCSGGNHSTDAITSAAGQVGDCGGRRDSEISLLAPRRTEVETGRQIDDHPGFQLTIGDRLTNVRMSRPSSHRPVHLSDVVARLVLPRVAGLGTGSRNQSEVVAVQHTVETTADCQFQGAQRRSKCGVA